MFRKTLVLAYLLAAACAALLAARGAAFYAAPLPLRARHPGYWTYKAGGSVGHPLGVAGSTMMVLLLGYSLRKRVRALRRLGPLSRWLDVHIFLGLLGPVLVILHSSFKVQGLVALSFWSMVVVACQQGCLATTQPAMVCTRARRQSCSTSWVRMAPSSSQA